MHRILSLALLGKRLPHVAVRRPPALTGRFPERSVVVVLLCGRDSGSLGKANRVSLCRPLPSYTHLVLDNNRMQKVSRHFAV